MSNVLITGATGMVGKGVLLECIRHPQINSITLISRSLVDIQDPKIKQILLDDFLQIDTIRSHLGIIDGCFHCMGVSAVGMSEEQYTWYTFEITRKLADLCFDLNPHMTFNYVSGLGTDSSEKGRQMWARVKGKTENYLLAKGFDKSYMFRPGLIIPEKGIKSRTRLYNQLYSILKPLFPLLKKMNSVTTTTKIGQAMISSLLEPRYAFVYLENKTINKIAG